MPVRSPSPDTFSSFTSPPPNESPSDRAARLSRETEARRVSNSIDEGIREERAVIRRREKEVIKVLLLGQAESGKSTTLKNFRMKYAKEAWRAERTSWRAAILLNVVKAVLNILHALSTRPAHSSLETPTADLSPGTEQPPLSSVPSSPVDPPSDNLSPGSPTATAMSMSIMQHPPSLASLRPSLSHPTSQGTLPAEHAQFVERLLEPLLRLERELKVHLGPASEEIGEFGMPEAAEHAHPDGSPKQQISPTSPSDSHHAHHDDDEHDQTHDHLQSPTPFDIPRPPPAQPPENEHVSPRALGIDTNVGVHAGTGTVSAGAITPATATAPSPATGPSSAITPATATNGTTTMNTAARDLVQKRRYANGFLVRCWPGGPCRAREREGDPPSPIDLTRISSVLAPLVPDMNALWADPVAKELVRRRRVRVEDGVEFLLTDLARVTAPAYVPTDDDIICCRLRTTGVTEYALTFPTGMEEEEGGLRSKLPRISFGKEWIMYDVGGARTNRYAWQSYFENGESSSSILLLAECITSVFPRVLSSCISPLPFCIRRSAAVLCSDVCLDRSSRIRMLFFPRSSST